MNQFIHTKSLKLYRLIHPIKGSLEESKPLVLYYREMHKIPSYRVFRNLIAHNRLNRYRFDKPISVSVLV